MPHIHELFDFTVSGYVLHPTQPKILLLKHLKLGKWLQPGGHIELHEDPIQALYHELEEEAGLKPEDYEILEPAEQPHPTFSKEDIEKVLPLPFYFNVHNYDAKHKHIDLAYLIRAKTTRLTENPDGAEAIAWLSLDEIRSLRASDELFPATLDVCEWIFAHKF